MTVNAHASGTQTCTIGTEHTLDQVSVAGTFQAYFDLSNMAAGDVVEIRAKQILLHSGSLAVVETAVFQDAQPVDACIIFTSELSNELTDTGSLTFTIKQTYGTGRNIPWKVLALRDEAKVDAIKAVTDSLAATVWNALTSGFSTAGSIGKLLKDNIDAAISSRSTYAGADTSGTTTLLSRITQAILFTAGGNVKADVEEWKASTPNALISGRVDANAQVVGDKTGYALTAGEHTVVAGDVATAMTSQGYTGIRAGYLDTLNGLVAAVWNALTSGFATTGSIGKLLKDDIDATVSSRSTLTQSQILSDATPFPGADIDAAISSVSGGGGITVAQIWDYLTSSITTAGSIGKLLKDDIDATISSRLASASYTAPDNADITAIKAKTDNLPASPAATGDAMTLTAGEHTNIAADTQTGLTAQGYSTIRAGYLDTLNGLVAAIWNALTSGFSTAGSIGKLLKDDIDAPISSVGGGGGGGGGGGATAAQIWDYLTSAITTSGSIGKFILDQLDIKTSQAKADTAAQITNAGIAGSTITIMRGDKMSVSVTGLGGLTSRTKLYFTVKRSTNDGDTDSTIQIEETGQLLRFNKATPADGTKGTLTVNDATLGNITLALDQTYTALLDVDDFSYDVEMVTASGVQTLTSGKFSVSPDVTRATS